LQSLQSLQSYEAQSHFKGSSLYQCALFLNMKTYSSRPQKQCQDFVKGHNMVSLNHI